MDDSSIEANAVHDAFGGINQGEMAVKVFLCKVHSMRTLLRHLGNDPNCRKLLLQAMHARTSFKCETLINQAISINRNGKKQYIRKRWNLERSRMWATWSRTHSPILLQVTTTNSVENYHSELKRKGNINLGLHCGFQGVLLGTDELLKQKMIQRKKRIELDAMKQSKIVSMYPELQKLPLAVQQMIHNQYQAALKRFEEGRSYQISTETYVCSCDFYYKYLLPCKHMFFEDLGIEGDSFFDDECWDDFTDDWEECGFDVYYGKETYATEPTTTNDDLPNRRFNEMQERIRTAYYRYENNPDLQKAFLIEMDSMLSKLNDLDVGSTNIPIVEQVQSRKRNRSKRA
jgi:hypothetical protein